jgi:hypothetical protein
MAGERPRPEDSPIDLRTAWTGEARDKFDALRMKIAEAFANVPIEEGLAEIDAAVASVQHAGTVDGR